MLIQVQQLLEKWLGIYKLGHYVYDDIINCHHNYASLEHHYGEDVWVHRKGATRAREGELAVIPGAMGSYSYVVMGLEIPKVLSLVPMEQVVAILAPKRKKNILQRKS